MSSSERIKSLRKLNGMKNENGILCNCWEGGNDVGFGRRIMANLKKVSKNGENKDRRFYGCGNSAEKRCGFFLWVDDAQHFGQPPVCEHKLFCRVGISKKGKFPGRKYYACGNHGSSCATFRWVPEKQAPVPSLPTANKQSATSKSINQLEEMLSDLSLTSSLPDKGEKLRGRLEHLRTQKSSELEQKTQLAQKMELKEPETEFESMFAKMNKLSISSPAETGIPSISSELMDGLSETLSMKSRLLTDNEPLHIPFLKSSLYPHQNHGVRWLISRENPSSLNLAGGILADDMGLGKTLQVISLILSRARPKNLEMKESECKSTLIVCPLALLNQWESEVMKHVDENVLRVIRFHGPNRNSLFSSLTNYDIVVTTYSVVSMEMKKKTDFSKISWWRIILDEAHCIKNPKTLIHQGCCQLQGMNRWFLTATPVQNNLDDLHSAIKFLHYSPFDNDAFLKQLFKTSSHLPKQREETIKLIIQPILLRRTKSDKKGNGEELLTLPEKTVEIHALEFLDPETEGRYKTLLRECQSALCLPWNQKKETSNMVLKIILRMRQLCNHPSLDRSSKEKSEEIDEVCYFCQEPISQESVKISCGHLFCQECILKSYDESRLCPICKENIDLNSLQLVANTQIGKMTQKSAKIKFLVDHLIKIKGSSQEQSIVFSQWTSMLDVIEFHLKEANIEFCRFDGKMNSDTQNEQIKKFKSEQIPVILISLKSGGVGLNLVEANHVFAMDVWWNPAVEEQAFDRCYRIGQTRNVFVHRLVIKDSVEEKMLALQDKKRSLAQKALSRETIQGKRAQSTLSAKDLRELLFS